MLVTLGDKGLRSREFPGELRRGVFKGVAVNGYRLLMATAVVYFNYLIPLQRLPGPTQGFINTYRGQP